MNWSSEQSVITATETEYALNGDSTTPRHSLVATKKEFSFALVGSRKRRREPSMHEKSSHQDPHAIPAHSFIRTKYFMGPTSATYDLDHSRSPLEIPRLAPGIHPMEYVSSSLRYMIPDDETLCELITMYFTRGNWIYRYLDEANFNDRLALYKEDGYLDDLTLATFFALCSVAASYVPHQHRISRVFAEPLADVSERYYQLCMFVLKRSSACLLGQPSVPLLEILLLTGHHLLCAKKSDSGEEISSLRGQMVGLATSIGLHRELGTGSVCERVRRRWVWWNIVVYDRYNSLILGRPISISNSHFDTEFPVFLEFDPTVLADSDNTLLPYIMMFHFSTILGDILDDLGNIAPMTRERVQSHAKKLVEWEEGWPEDMKINESGMPPAALHSPRGVTRRGTQAMHLNGQARLARIALHQSPDIARNPADGFEMWNIDCMTAAASSLIFMYHRSGQAFSLLKLEHRLVPGAVMGAPYALFTACVFFCYQLLSRPDHPKAEEFKDNLTKGINAFGQIRTFPIAETCFRTLMCFFPTPDDHHPDNVARRSERLTLLRRLMCSYVDVNYSFESDMQTDSEGGSSMSNPPIPNLSSAASLLIVPRSEYYDGLPSYNMGAALAAANQHINTPG